MTTTQAQSKIVYMTGQKIISATLSTTETIAGADTITYYLSANNGLDFEAVTNGVSHTFTKQGARLVWKAVFNGTGGSNTYFEDLKISVVDTPGVVYDEYFADIEYMDSSTTMTWGTSALIGTTSQIAVSKKLFECDTTTITEATLTSTETSGSFTYQLSNNGGSNWESCSSGVKHTFLTTGNDLRYKITCVGSGTIARIYIEKK